MRAFMADSSWKAGLPRGKRPEEARLIEIFATRKTSDGFPYPIRTPAL